MPSNGTSLIKLELIIIKNDKDVKEEIAKAFGVKVEFVGEVYGMEEFERKVKKIVKKYEEKN